MSIDVTPGSGKTVATSTMGGLEYQQIIIYQGQVSVLGTVSLTGTPSISGAVTVVGNPSISGQVNVGSVFGAHTLYAQLDSLTSAVTSVLTTTTSVITLAAPSSTLRNHITHIMATNSGAVGTYVNILDSGNVLYAGYAAASGGGFSATLPVPIRQTTSGLGLFVATTATTSVVVAVSGYKAL